MIAILNAVSLMLIVWLVFFAYQAYRVDKLRQDLFTIRDQLFDEALNGNIAFDDEAYKISRQMVNGMIRFAHRLSIPSMFAFAFLMPRKGTAFSKGSVAEMIDGASPKSLDLFTKYQVQINSRIAAHVVSSPVFVLTALVPVLTFALTKLGIDITRPILNSCKQAFQILDNAAYAQGANA
jgi:hypothetical protein